MPENPHRGQPGLRATPRSMTEVGLLVAAVRRAAGLTQAQLAAQAGVGRRFVNELETGHSTLFADRLFAVLAELNLQVHLEASPPAQAALAATGQLRATARVVAVPPVKDLGW